MAPLSTFDFGGEREGGKTGETGEEFDLFKLGILIGLAGLADRTRFHIERPIAREAGTTMHRRRFLQMMAVGIVAVVTDEACGEKREEVRELAHPALLEMLGTERTREIGTQYRAAVPRERTIAALRSAISSSHSRGFARRFRRSIEAQVHDDFEAGRTVLVGGWVLSTTEARQCALYSLSA